MNMLHRKEPVVQITIDGKAVLVPAGSNLLEAALTSGVDVPHLCYDPRLKPFGSCRLCFVEIAGRPAAVPACGTQVNEGMEITTNSEGLADLRRTALELLISEHCGDCVAPCQQACPAGIDIQGFVAHIANGQVENAAALIKEKLPLPSVCGRVCPRFCEDECRRNIVDEPVNICTLKRFAGDYDLMAVNSYSPQPLPDSGFHVAVVGGGPAGLTAAYYLTLAGHRVTLYDFGPELGGMLRYGIPEYRLPKQLLDQEISLITQMCHEVRLGEVMGRDFTLEQLRAEFDAVFLGLGCRVAQGMRLAGEDMPGVLKGIDFLRMVVEGSPPDVGRSVAVVGGGNTAMDAARTSLRLGAEKVVVVYRRSRDEMPASPLEIEEAEEEGVEFRFLTNPVTFMERDGCVEGIECIRMELGEPDSSGRRRPVEIKGSKFSMEFDTVILAIGQVLEKEAVEACGLGLSSHGNVQACSDTGCTTEIGVFSAGDCVTGAATVVQAVAAAREAARAIDFYLHGMEYKPEEKPFNCRMGELKELDPADFADMEKIARVPESHLPPLERAVHFQEFNLGLSEEGIKQEAQRCLSCGCEDVFDCSLRKLATEYQVDTASMGMGKKRYQILRDHRYVHNDPNKCVLCGNCVRICQEVQDVSAWGFAHRGFDTVVMPALGLPLAETLCESCGQCVSACPTGALSAAGFQEKPGPFKDDSVVPTTCVQCGIGCALELHVVGKKITRITSPLRNEVNSGSLCKKGVFEYDFVHNPDRLKTPLLKTADKMQEVSWDEALSVAAEGLGKIRDRFGPDSIAVLVSPKLSNEENYLAQKVARVALQTNNIESTAPVTTLNGERGDSPQENQVRYNDLVSSDLIIVLNTDPTTEYPIIAHKIREALQKGGRLAVIGQHATRLDEQAEITVRVNSRKILKLLQIIQAYLQRYEFTTEGYELSLTGEEIKHLLLELPDTVRVKPTKVIGLIQRYLRAKRPIIVVDGEALGAAESAALQAIVRSTGNYRPGRGILEMFKAGNSRGQLDMGVHPHLLPGRKSLQDIAVRQRYNQITGKPLPTTTGRTLPEIMHAAQTGEIVGMVIIGDDFSLDNQIFAEGMFTVVMASTWRPDLTRADVVLPAATFAETQGTVTNCEGRLQLLNAAFPPPAGKDNLTILKELAYNLGVDVGEDAPEVMLKEMQTISAWHLLEEKFFSAPESSNQDVRPTNE